MDSSQDGVGAVRARSALRGPLSARVRAARAARTLFLAFAGCKEAWWAPKAVSSDAVVELTDTTLSALLCIYL